MLQWTTYTAGVIPCDNYVRMYLQTQCYHRKSHTGNGSLFLFVFPLSPYAALIRGILIIAWPHGRPSSLGEEAETGEGRCEVHQRPATSHLSCHPCYASHGIPHVASGRQRAGCLPLGHTNSLHPQSVSIWMWVNKRVSLEICISPLTFIQVICEEVEMQSEESQILEVFTAADAED